MKVSDTIETLGYFWLPDTPDKKIPGMLSVSRHGEISVDLFRILGDYETELNSIINQKHQGINRISGIVRDGGYVTLTECDYLSFSTSLDGGVDKVILGAQAAYVGVDFQQGKIALTEYDFWVEGLSEWLNRSGITTTTNLSDGSGTIEFHQPEPILHTLSDGTTMKFDFSSTGPSSLSINAVTEVRVTQTPFISLISTEPKPIEYFNSLATKLTKFLTLVVDRNVQIQSVKVFVPHETNGDIYNHPVRLYRAFHPVSSNDVRVSPHDFLFSYPTILDFSKMINVWLKNYEPDTYANALNSYFASKSSSRLPLTTRFLNLCQSMESLHGIMFPGTRIMPRPEFNSFKTRVFNLLPPDFPEPIKAKIGEANRPSLRSRLESLLSPFEEWFGGEELSKKFAKHVADTRNYLTHLHDRDEDQAQNTQELRELFTQLDTLALLYMLKLIGLDKHDIAILIQQTTSRLHQELGHIDTSFDSDEHNDNTSLK